MRSEYCGHVTGSGPMGGGGGAVLGLAAPLHSLQSVRHKHYGDSKKLPILPHRNQQTVWIRVGQVSRGSPSQGRLQELQIRSAPASGQMVSVCVVKRIFLKMIVAVAGGRRTVTAGTLIIVTLHSHTILHVLHRLQHCRTWLQSPSDEIHWTHDTGVSPLPSDQCPGCLCGAWRQPLL